MSLFFAYRTYIQFNSLPKELNYYNHYFTESYLNNHLLSTFDILATVQVVGHNAKYHWSVFLELKIHEKWEMVIDN